MEDKVKNPVKKNSSNANVLLSFRPVNLSIALTTEKPRTKKTKRISIQTNRTRIILYALNNPYLMMQYKALKPSFHPIFLPSS